MALESITITVRLTGKLLDGLTEFRIKLAAEQGMQSAHVEARDATKAGESGAAIMRAYATIERPLIAEIEKQARLLSGAHDLTLPEWPPHSANFNTAARAASATWDRKPPITGE